MALEHAPHVDEHTHTFSENMRETAQGMYNAAHHMGEKMGIFEHREEEANDFGASSLNSALNTVADVSKATVQSVQEKVGNIPAVVSNIPAVVSDNIPAVVSNIPAVVSDSIPAVVSGIKEVAQEGAENIKGMTHEAINYTSQAALSLGEKIGVIDPNTDAQQKLHNVVEFGAASLHSLVNTVSATAQSVQEKTIETAETVKDTAATGVEKTKETAENVKDKAEDVSQVAFDGATNLKQRAKPATDLLNEGVSNLKDKALEGTKKVTQTASGVTTFKHRVEVAIIYLLQAAIILGLKIGLFFSITKC